MIFVGINTLFRLFDTAYEHLNSLFPLASVPFFAVLIQHYPLELVNAVDFNSEEGRRAGNGSHTKTLDKQKSIPAQDDRRAATESHTERS